MTKISVIISTYNRNEMLKRAVQSVIDQTFTNWELIIVHDGPAVEPLPSFDDPRISIFHTEANFGSDTRPKNEGIKAATGDYIAFLDDDNEFYPDHLLILAKEVEQHPEIDVMYGDRLIVDDTKELQPQIGIHSDFNPALLMERNYIDTSDVLVKKAALFLVGGFDERYKKYVDWNIWIRMMKAGVKFLHIPKVITTYHLHKDMKSLRIKDTVGDKPFGDSTPTRVFKPEWDAFELEIILPYLGEQPLPRVAVFTLVKDRLEYTKQMYASLKKAGYPFDWFVVDQGSTDGTNEWLHAITADAKEHQIQMNIIHNKQNTGISIGSNQALNAIGDKYDFIIKIDNDCEILSENWLDRLLEIFTTNWQMVLSPYVEGLIDNPGGMARLGYHYLRGHMLGFTKHIGGIFTMTHTSAYENFRWDEDDFLHGMQDLVFTTEIQKRGFLCAYVEDMRVSHIDTTQGQKEKYPEYFALRNKERTQVYKA